MKEFVLLFRQPGTDFSKVSPKEMQDLAQKWNDWIENIKSQGRYAKDGLRLSTEGKVLKPGGVVTDGPFAEIREILGGFFVVKAENLDDATTLAHGCPVLEAGGSVEIRPLYR